VSAHLVYPAPTLVIGVGRLGLATLERLGDDWMGLKLSGADPSVRNLRLISARAASPARRSGHPGAGAGDGDVWRRQELPAAHIARYLGDGDLPSRALDLAVLRSLGLVRFRDGTYQVGMPRDGGVVELDHRESGDEAPLGGHPRAHRRRYFEWVNLSPDPLVAAERLRQATEQSKELDLFLTPLVNRVRQGSPGALLATIGRCFALLEGRDPGPWRWLGDGFTAGAAGLDGPDGELRLPLGEADPNLADGASLGTDLGLGDVPEPLPGWQDWARGASDGAAPGGPPPPELALRVPATFVPSRQDPATPVAPRELLARDWQATSWAIEERDGGSPTFLPLPVTPFRLGLFDHDGREVDPEVRERFRERLRELGRQVHSGLVRLWVDLQRVQVAETDTHLKLEGRPRDEVADALQQSLEILGELVVRPLAAGETEETPSSPAIPPDDGEAARTETEDMPARPPAAAERELPDAPSRFLAGMIVDEGSSADPIRRLVAERLADLGLGEPGELEGFRTPLLSDHLLRPGDVSAADGRDLGACALDAALRPPGLQALRETLNAHVRSLLDFDFLSRYRSRPTRRPPRLTVFVVGDMSEPFVRASLRPILREVHAELLRAFTPVFRTYREGFDRSLCVTPILWMPHPADPFQGGDPEATRREEAAIIDAVHGIRHWVECVLPAGKRFIPQIFVNSRVTDVSTLTLRDAVRQTRDFLSFQMRSDMAGDPWLRAIAAGSGQADLFSSFSCYETDFPALRCREYLANRMSRELLGVILDPPAPSPRAAIADREEETLVELAPPPVGELVEGIRGELQGVTGRAGEEARGAVMDALSVTEATRASEVEQAYDEAFEAALRRRILERWRELTGRLGKIDDMVDDLRRRTGELLTRRVQELREHSDRAILDSIGEGGLARALGRLHRLRSRCRDLFQEHEAGRKEGEELAARHAIPELRPLVGARTGLLAAAGRKPDLAPLRLGAGLLAAFALVLGAPLAHAVAYLGDLHLRGGLTEALLGPMAPLTGGLALWLPAWMLLRWHLRRRTRAVQEAQEGLARAAERILRGTGRPLASEPPTSIRSFLEARLELTGAVATRGFALRVFERVLADTHLAERLRRSLDVQSQILQRRAEDLGVRATLDAGERGEEDLDRLLAGQGLDRTERLISGDSLRRYYHQSIRQPSDLQAELPCFVPAAGGIDRWRTEACLAHTEAILGYCRHTFHGIVDEAIWAQPFFRDDVARSLGRFVERCYSNLGFGAEFRGYEGLDPDGVPVLADAALVLHRELARVYSPTTRTLAIRKAEIRPNAAYMLSLVQGIRVHSLRNLRRFESFHDRSRMPDDRAFPLTQETRAERSHRPVNLLSGLEAFTRERSRTLLGADDPPDGRSRR
jgi:hypothetical protein